MNAAVVVRRADHHDLDEMAEVLGDAFADYPATRWTVDHRDHRDRVVALQRLSLDHLGLAFGEAWVAEVDGAIASVAVWMDSRIAVPASVWSAMADEQRALEGDRADVSRGADDLLDGLRPIEPHLYLGAVGTATAHQGRGLARRLLAVATDTADAAGVSVYLETSTITNVDLYGSLGFAITQTVEIPSGPTIWAMVRPPATRA